MAEPLTITVTLERRGPAAAIVLTDDQVAGITGGAKVAPVTVTVEGHGIMAGRIARMGGENMIGLNKAVRTELGVEAGDELRVTIELDAGERTIEVPADLSQALAGAGLTDTFAALAPSHRKEYVRWVTEAKKPETRQRRVAETITRLRA